MGQRGWRGERVTIIIPSLVETHAHLDKAFLAERVPNVTGDLRGAIEAMEAARPTITEDDTTTRAERAARLMLANGVSAIRTHADVTEGNGLASIEALVEVRRRLAGEMTLQIVALCGWPVVGPAGRAHRALLAEAMAAGADLVGGCPHLEDDPAAATETLMDIAENAGAGLDLHTDENLRAESLALELLARRVLATGFERPVTASHCVSLSMQPEARQRQIAEQVGAAGIGVIALPHTNLFLQGRDHPQATPRGITAVRALRAAGVRVAAGADNLQDPFNPLGRGDPLETAGLMVLAAHALPDEALAMVTTEARAVLGLAADGADLVVDADSVREAIACTPSRTRR